MRHATLVSISMMVLWPPLAGSVPQLAVNDPRGYVCYRGTSPIAVDGRLDDGAWRDAPWTDDFVDIEGDKKPRPRFARGRRCSGTTPTSTSAPSSSSRTLWATITQHDAVIFHDNDFEFFIDPNGDNHEYDEFEINALGTGWDLLLPRPYKDGGKAVNNWELVGLKSAVHLDGTLNVVTDTDRGWSVELAVPWSALGELARRTSPPADGDQWRVNFSRVQWALEVANGAYRKVPKRPENNWVWSPQHVVNMHRPETWGYVQFSTARPGSATFRPDASLPARRWLHEVYYAQIAFRQKNKRWATSFEELRVTLPQDGSLTAGSLHTAGTQWEASVALRVETGKSERWHIRQDSLVEPERTP